MGVTPFGGLPTSRRESIVDCSASGVATKHASEMYERDSAAWSSHSLTVEKRQMITLLGGKLPSFEIRHGPLLAVPGYEDVLCCDVSVKLRANLLREQIGLKCI